MRKAAGSDFSDETIGGASSALCILAFLSFIFFGICM